MQKIFLIVLLLFSSLSAGYASIIDKTVSALTSVDKSIIEINSKEAFNLKNGPLKVLLIGEMRTTSDLCMNLSGIYKCDIETFLTGSTFSLKAPDTAGIVPDDYSERRIKTLLADSVDVLWLDFDFKSLPGDIAKLIIEKADKGMGIVYTGKAEDFKGFYSQEKGDRTLYIPISDVLENMPVFLHTPADKRVIALGYLPDKKVALNKEKYCAVSNLILTAAGKNRGFYLTSMKKPGRAVEFEALQVMKYKVGIYNTSGKRKISFVSKFIDDDGNLVKTTKSDFDIKDGNLIVNLPYPIIPCGSYTEEIYAFENDNLINYSIGNFKIKSELQVKDLKLSVVNFEQGELIYGNVRVKPEFKEGMSIQAELYDSYGRMIQRTPLEIELYQGKGSFSLGSRHYSGCAFTVKIKLYSLNNLVQTLKKKVFIGLDDDNGRFRLGVLDKYDHLSDIEGYDSFLKTYGVDDVVLSFNSPYTKKDYGENILNLLNGSDFYPVIQFNGVEEKENVESFFDIIKEYKPHGYILETSEELKKSGHFDNTFENFRSIIKGKDGKAEIGIFDSLLTNDPVDESKINGEIGYRISKGIECSNGSEINMGNSIDARCFSVIDKNLFTFDNSRIFASMPWYSMFSGLDGVIWEKGYNSVFSALTPYNTAMPAFSILSGQKKIINGGIDKIVNGSEKIFQGNGSDKSEYVKIEGGLKDSLNVYIFKSGDFLYAGFVLSPYIESLKTYRFKITVKCEKPLYLFDMLKGNYLGVSDSFILDLEPGEAGFVSMLPYKVQTVMLKLKTPFLNLGEYLSFSTEVISQTKDSKMGKHILRMRLIPPDGIILPYYDSAFETELGQFNGEIYFPLHETKGKWVLEVEDIASGKKTSNEITLR